MKTNKSTNTSYQYFTHSIFKIFFVFVFLLAITSIYIHFNPRNWLCIITFSISLPKNNKKLLIPRASGRSGILARQPAMFLCRRRGLAAQETTAPALQKPTDASKIGAEHAAAAA